MDHFYVKIPRQNSFTPKYISEYSNINFRNKKVINDFQKPKIFPNNSYFSSKNKKNPFLISKNLKLSFGSRSLICNKINHSKSIMNNISSKKSIRSRPKSSSYKKVLHSFSRNSQGQNISKNNLSNLSLSKLSHENENLFIEINQIKKVIKDLEKELYVLKKENKKKDSQLSDKEEEINNIISNNKMHNVEDEKEDSNKNISSMGVLLFRIKKEIKNINSEIKYEKDKIDKLKSSSLITKTKELNVESKLYKEQYNKIKELIKNSLDFKAKNDFKMSNFEELKEKINTQKIIIDNLQKDNMSLNKEKKLLNNRLLNLKNKLELKTEKAKKNKKELKVLFLKNKDLNNSKNDKSQTNANKLNGQPTNIKCFYSNKVTELKKNINFYKKQCKYTEDMINKLKEQRKKLIDSNKNLEQKIKISQNFIEDTTKIKKLNRPISSIGTNSINFTRDEEIINKLKSKFRAIRENEISLRQKVNSYSEKIKEIEMENEQKERELKEKEEEERQNQIEFGIDESNPYYTDNEENVPESHIKFTSAQFNQFTYILFKNFEAKHIISEEANNKIINPFYDIIKKTNITNVSYPSKEYDIIIEEFTKIIMKVLNTDNEYNHILTKMFVGALLYNSDCDTNKLVEYFSILFSYTIDYALEEKKLIEKLKNKYKNQTKKLIECITSYMLNDLSSSQYFSLFKMKDILDANEIHLKDKYIEFLFYYMKKFSDPDAKLQDLKFSLLNDIVPLGDTSVHSKAFKDDNLNQNNNNNNNSNDKNENEFENLEEDININQKESIEDNEDENNISEIQKDSKIINSNNDFEKSSFEKMKNKNDNISKRIKKDNIYKNIINDETLNNERSNIDTGNKLDNKDIINIVQNKDKNEDNIDNNNNINKTNEKDNINDNINNNMNDNDLQDINNDINNINNINSNDDNKEEKLNQETDNKRVILTGNYENKEEIKTENENNKKENKKKDKKKYKEDEIVLKDEQNDILKNEENENGKEDQKSKKSANNNINDINANKDDTNANNQDDSITEITNEDYIKYLASSINLIQEAIQKKSTDFDTLMKEITYKNKIKGKIYEYINIEDLNEKLIEIGVTLNDLQISCLCSKYCLPDELRLIDKKKFEKSLKDNLKGELNLE